MDLREVNVKSLDNVTIETLLPFLDGVIISTASGTRSVMEGLFISFEKFLLQFLSCPAA